MDRFTEAYLEAAVWTLSEEDAHGSLTPNTAASIEVFTRAAADCARFQSENAAALEAVDALGVLGDTWASAGHDFWLTRNGHGAGFWDGDWPEPYAAQLTAAAKAFGEITLYAGDDGRLRFGA